jgi:hypothetical protein
MGLAQEFMNNAGVRWIGEGKETGLRMSLLRTTPVIYAAMPLPRNEKARSGVAPGFLK